MIECKFKKGDYISFIPNDIQRFYNQTVKIIDIHEELYLNKNIGTVYKKIYKTILICDSTNKFYSEENGREWNVSCDSLDNSISWVLDLNFKLKELIDLL